MKKINIAELLKNCPNGTKLYSPLCGECYFDRINMGTIICKKQNTQEITFTSEGYYMLPVFDDCECVLFPSKECRDWSKFQRLFKDGDIVVTTLNNIAIISEHVKKELFYIHALMVGDNFYNNENTLVFVKRQATKEEMQKLFEVIKKNGYRWNFQAKRLEKLIKPKFKVGDKIKLKNSPISSTVTKINDDGSICVNDYTWVIKYELQYKYELVPDKFDISTLQSYISKVLVRDDEDSIWQPCVWGLYDNGHRFPYVTTGNRYRYCIPYKGNEYLLGTTDDCSEYYKIWEN